MITKEQINKWRKARLVPPGIEEVGKDHLRAAIMAESDERLLSAESEEEAKKGIATSNGYKLVRSERKESIWNIEPPEGAIVWLYEEEGEYHRLVALVPRNEKMLAYSAAEREMMEHMKTALENPTVIAANISVWDAWLLLSSVQMTVTHPEISEVSLEQYRSLGKRLQKMINHFTDNRLNSIMERGWNREYDIDTRTGKPVKEDADDDQTG